MYATWQWCNDGASAPGVDERQVCRWRGDPSGGSGPQSALCDLGHTQSFVTELETGCSTASALHGPTLWLSRESPADPARRRAKVKGVVGKPMARNRSNRWNLIPHP